MCFGMLNFVAKFFPAAKTCQKCGHGPDSIFSMPDMAMPVSFADNTFWFIKRTGESLPGPFNKLCVFCYWRFFLRLLPAKMIPSPAAEKANRNGILLSVSSPVRGSWCQ